ncbi:MAG: hypothetical protein ABSC54_00815 [Smithellaceae bacterium]|jgi:hypothetical protein
MDKKAIDKLIADALKAYGIDKKFVASSNFDDKTEEAVIVTAAGKEVRFKAGAEVTPLAEVDIIKPKSGKNATGDKLIAEALDAFGIGEKYVAGSRIDDVTGEAVITTVGGTKVRYSSGAKVDPLPEIAITGINRAPKRKPITGGKDKK